MRHWLYLLVLAVIAILVVAPAISSAAQTRSGLFGSVRRGPTGPLCRPSRPCTAPATGVLVNFVRRGVVHRIRTGMRGRYSIRLAPGRYVIHIAGAQFGYSPRSAKVPRGRMAVLNIQIDTGIR